MATAHALMAIGKLARLARIRMAATQTAVAMVTNVGAIQTLRRKQTVSHVHPARRARPEKRVHLARRVRHVSHGHRARRH